MYVIDLVLLELLKENDAILDYKLSVSLPNCLKVEKVKGTNLKPFYSHLVARLLLFLSAT